MWVGSGEKALAYQKTLSPTRQRVTQNSLEKYVVHTELDQALFFIHPAYSKEEYERYQQALLKPIEDIQANKDVKENVTKIYWLLAQGTPVERGGSALANLILQYLAHECKIHIPHTKEGIDLWAYAALQPFESFQEKFMRGDYHDPDRKDQDVKKYISSGLKKLLDQAQQARGTTSPG